jgi:hypothetical protein
MTKLWGILVLLLATRSYGADLGFQELVQRFPQVASARAPQARRLGTQLLAELKATGYDKVEADIPGGAEMRGAAEEFFRTGAAGAGLATVKTVGPNESSQYVAVKSQVGSTTVERTFEKRSDGTVAQWSTVLTVGELSFGWGAAGTATFSRNGATFYMRSYKDGKWTATHRFQSGTGLSAWRRGETPSHVRFR